MSTIVAVKKDHKICIAADSLTTFGDSRQTATLDADSDKIFQFEDNYLGIVGSAAHQLVVQSALGKMKKVDFSSKLEIFKTFSRLHALLKERYYLNPKDEDDDPYESTHIDALIVNPNGIFAVFALREVFEYTRYWAIGSGSEYALGAMHAVYEADYNAEQVAHKAIEAGAEFNTGTAMPMSSYSMEMKSTEQPTSVLV